MGNLKTKASKAPMVYQDDEATQRILNRNRDKNFVRRILNPEKYPKVTSDPRLPKGSFATHQMSWTTIGPKDKPNNIVYPNIQYDAQSKQLNWPNPREAAKRAVETGEYISFGSDAAKAAQFSEKYKRGSPKGLRK